MRSVAEAGDLADPARDLRVAGAHRAWDRAAEVAAEAAAAAVGVADKDRVMVGAIRGSTEMNLRSAKRQFPKSRFLLGAAIASACLSVVILLAAQSQPVSNTSGVHVVRDAGPRGFNTPQQAATALITAADGFEVLDLIEIFGPGGDDVVLTGEYAADHQRATDFAAQAHEKTTVSVDPRNPTRAFLIVGRANWPFPVPMVKRGGKWFFDAAAGRQELLFRRIGYNELDAISICEGYVDAQHEYAWKPRQGFDVNQYAQRIISTPGTQDGLAWQNADGTWGGPIGEKAAVALAQGYRRGEPYHGYFFKILKGQGPAAPLGQMDFVIEGVMIGGFALAAAPAEYRVTGVKTFIVSHNGIVYQKDLGPATLDEFATMERYNPDKSWTPVPQEDQ